MSQVVVVLGFVFFSSSALGHLVGLGFGIGGTQSEAPRSFNATYQQDVARLFDGKFEVAAGIRYSNYSKSGDLDLGSSKQVIAAAVNVHSVNIFGGLRYWLDEAFFAGMNLDFLGFSWGPERDVRTTAGVRGQARPAGTNLFLGGKNDRGSLNSEFFIGTKVSPDLHLKLGWSHQVIEYEAAISTEKAQRFYDLFFVGLDLAI